MSESARNSVDFIAIFRCLFGVMMLSYSSGGWIESNRIYF